MKIRSIFISFVFLFIIFISGCSFPVNSTLKTPIVSIDENGKATWSEVLNASYYTYKVNDILYQTVDTFVFLEEGDTISVSAVSIDENYKNSKWSKPLTYLKEESFTVTFKNYDGAVLYTTVVNKGEAAIYEGEVPVRPSDSEYEYLFSGWDKKISTITCDLEVTAVFTKKELELSNRVDIPNITVNENGALSWDSVENAKSYAYILNDVEYTTNDLFIFVEDGDKVSVKAIGDEPYEDSKWSDTVEIEVSIKGTNLRYNAKDLMDYNVYAVSAMPSTGKQTVLVIPVWFSDSNKYISSSKKNEIRNHLNKVFFGTNEDTGWHSVKSYFYEDSYGKLEMGGIVTDWYETAMTGKNITATGVDLLVYNSVEWFKDNYSGDIREFDSDANGDIDAVCLIYGNPNSDTIGSSNDNLWAYCYWLQDENEKNVYNPGPNNYLFASYDFMYSEGGNTDNCLLDAHTYIHEMGHMMGLDDYYDYSDKSNPAGGFSMQDFNVGGHDPYSKISLDWVDPYVVNDSCVLTIKPFESSGDVILIASNPSGSTFDEYLLIELYTPTGLNEFDTINPYGSNWPVGPTGYGIRIWHVDSRLGYVSDANNEEFTDQKITTEISNRYYYINATTNTYPASGYTDYCSEIKSFRYYNTLQLIRNNESYDFMEYTNLSNKDLFQSGDVFTLNKFNKQFVKTGEFNNGSSFNFTITFVNVTSEAATIKIEKTK